MSTQHPFDVFTEQQRSAGREEGRQQGRQEGREEGRDEGLAEAILEVYTGRFGPPRAKVAAIVRQTHDREVLRRWVKLVATAPVEEVNAALRR